MKVNKTNSPLVNKTDAPAGQESVSSVQNSSFAEALSALDSASASDSAQGATHNALMQIAAQYDLSDDAARQSALQESAEFLVKSRLNEKQRESKKVVSDLSKFVAEDPFLKTKLLSVLQKLNKS